MFYLLSMDHRVIAAVKRDDKIFPDAVDFNDREVILDKSLWGHLPFQEVCGVYKTTDRAAEVADAIVNAFYAGEEEFTMPRE